MIEINQGALLEWVEHLQDEDSSGAWNGDDNKMFDQILDDHTKARKWDESLLGAMLERDEMTVGDYMQNIKLKELIEKRIESNKTRPFLACGVPSMVHGDNVVKREIETRILKFLLKESKK